jgi:hypothetical protein
MKADCSYCALAEKKGQLFCSRHSTDMKSLDSGVFFIREKFFEECDWHVTRLSLNFNFDGSQSYFVGNREHRIRPDKYLLLNEGQSFKTMVESEHENRMVTVAFKVGLAAQICQMLVHDDAYLLDHPHVEADPLNFFEKTYPMDPFLHHKILSLISSSDAGPDREGLNHQM